MYNVHCTYYLFSIFIKLLYTYYFLPNLNNRLLHRVHYFLIYCLCFCSSIHNSQNNKTKKKSYSYSSSYKQYSISVCAVLSVKKHLAYYRLCFATFSSRTSQNTPPKEAEIAYRIRVNKKKQCWVKL